MAVNAMPLLQFTMLSKNQISTDLGQVRTNSSDLVQWETELKPILEALLKGYDGPATQHSGTSWNIDGVESRYINNPPANVIINMTSTPGSVARLHVKNGNGKQVTLTENIGGTTINKTVQTAATGDTTITWKNWGGTASVDVSPISVKRLEYVGNAGDTFLQNDVLKDTTIFYVSRDGIDFTAITSTAPTTEKEVMFDNADSKLVWLAPLGGGETIIILYN